MLLNHADLSDAHLRNAELEDTLVAAINLQPKDLPSPLFPRTHGLRNGCCSRCCRTLHTIRVRENQEPISLLTLLHRTPSGKRC
jgi:hypothetical protein